MSSELQTAAEKTLKCVRCGFCLDACPTFRLTGNEADSPRGRIYLMRSVFEKSIELDDDVRTHIDACLGCRACETACPSGVQYGDILEEFRARIETEAIRPAPQRFARHQLLNTLTSPTKSLFAMRAGAMMERITGGKPMPAVLSNLLTGDPKAVVQLPSMSGSPKIGKLLEVSPAVGERSHRVGILAGCVMRVMFHATNEATVRVLQQNGCDVFAPKAAGCCGALHLHTGFKSDAITRAKALIDAFAPLNLDAIIINSAGCGSTMKEYGHLLADNPEYAEKAANFAAKCKDVSEYLIQIGITAPLHSYDKIVAYHDACHLAHGQKITSQPRQLLRSIPGLDLVDLPESDTCCGSAGIYNLTQPVMAKRLLERKIEFIRETGASVIAAGNPGCIAWIQQGLKSAGLDVAIRHPIDILDEAYSGVLTQGG